MTVIATENDVRCERVTRRGPCLNAVAPGEKTCARHPLMNRGPKVTKRQMLYEMGQFQSRVAQFSGDTELKTLHGEIAVLRNLLEVVHQQCDSSIALVVKASIIGDLCAKITATVNTCNNIEAKLGGLLDRAKVTQLAEQTLQAVTDQVEKYITDDKVKRLFLKGVSESMLEILE